MNSKDLEKLVWDSVYNLFSGCIWFKFTHYSVHNFIRDSLWVSVQDSILDSVLDSIDIKLQSYEF